MTECEDCGGSGIILVAVTYTGEAIAGEWVEVECPECDGQGTFED